MMGLIRFLLLVSLSFSLAPPQKSSAIATTIKSYSSSLGLCTDGITFSATIEENLSSRLIAIDDIQDLVIHADDIQHKSVYASLINGITVSNAV